MSKLRVLAAAAAFTLLTGMAACPDPNRPAERGAPAETQPTDQPAAAGKQAPAGDAAQAGTVVARIGDDEITLSELDAAIASELYEMRSQAIERMVAEQLLEQEAKQRGLSGPEELIQQEVEAKVPDPSDEAIAQFYEQQGLAQRGVPLERARDRIVQMMTQQQKGERFQALLTELKQKQKVSVDLPRPRTQVAAEGPAKGPAGAPVTIVEFSEFECPYCSRVLPTLEAVRQAYGDKVRVVFRHFPLPFHQNAQKAAEASACAADQGKFWEYHDVLFANQKALGPDQLIKHAEQVDGLDASKLKACLDSNAKAKKVQQDMEAGRKAGVSGTPAFFINGIMVSGALPLEEFKKIIDQELEQGSGS